MIRGRAPSLPQVLLAVLNVTLVACGNDHQPLGPQPTPRPTQTSFATPRPTQTGAPTLPAMKLGETGRATSVNGREWIVVRSSPAGAVLGFQTAVVLPPDAGPDAGPLPELACFDSSTLPDGSCFHEFDLPLDVAETDWLSGLAVFVSGGAPSAVAVAFQSGGAARSLDSSAASLPCLVPTAETIGVGPGPLFFALATCRLDGIAATLPVVWRSADAASLALLPMTGFSAGPRPARADADGRIAGAGIVPELPVVWRLAGDAYTLERLPLLDGGTRGGALGIDAGQIVGWSDDASGDEHAVAWQEGAEGFAVEQLPRPDFATSCARATASSAQRIAGLCADDGGSFGVVWTAGETDGWRVELLLGPVGAGDSAALGISGDLAVGWSGSDARPVPAAWRLPHSDAAPGGSPP